MLVKLYQVDLPVSDMDRAESFYQQLLNVPNKRVSPERHQFDCGGMILTCSRAGQEQESHEAAASQEIFLAVDDLETIFLQAQQAGCASLDQEIINQPWGHRSFTAQDPFGNSIVFVDEASMQQQMNERLTAGPDELFQRGVALSIESLAEDSQHQPIAASVAKIFQDEIWIRFAKPPPDALFEDNESVRVHFWVGEEVFLSKTTVVKAPSNSEHVAISIPREATALKRRAVPRVPFPIPISFSVFASTDSEEIGEKSFQTESKDMSTNGIRLETEAPLKKGDRVWLQLSLSSSETIRVVANVMRTKQINAEKISAGLEFVEIRLEDQMKLLKLLLQDVQREPSQAAPEQEETAPPANQKADESTQVAVNEESSVQLDVAQETRTPIHQQEETPTPLEVAVDPSAALDTARESGAAQEEALPAPVKVEEEASAELGATRESGEEEEAPPPVEEPEFVTEDETVPLEVKEETPVPLETSQEVGAAQAKKEAPAPVKEQEEVAPEEEKEEEEGEEEFLLPVVLIVPEVQGGRVLLELTNGYHKPLQLTGVLVKRGVHSIQLLDKARELPVEETETLDVTEKMLTLFDPESSKVQYKRFQISLTLEPEPLDQPAPATYVLSFSKGSFNQFSEED